MTINSYSYHSAPRTCPLSLRLPPSLHRGPALSSCLPPFPISAFTTRIQDLSSPSLPPLPAPRSCLLYSSASSPAQRSSFSISNPLHVPRSSFLCLCLLTRSKILSPRLLYLLPHSDVLPFPSLPPCSLPGLPLPLSVYQPFLLRITAPFCERVCNSPNLWRPRPQNATDNASVDLQAPRRLFRPVQVRGRRLM